MVGKTEIQQQIPNEQWQEKTRGQGKEEGKQDDNP
jgi:hypothetical protein